MDTPPPPYRALREATGLSQRAIERELRWRTGQLSLIERGLIPTVEERRALLTYYNEWLGRTLRDEATA